MPKATAQTRRLKRLGRACAWVDDMHADTVRLINQLSQAPRFAKSAADAVKRQATRCKR